MGRSKNRKKSFAIIGVVSIALFVAAIVAFPITSSVVPNGTVKTVYAGQYYGSEFRTNGSGTLKGSVNANNGITFYLMTPSEYSSFVSSGTPNSYAFTSGDVNSGSFNFNIDSGTWYAVYYNSNLISSSTITINSLTFTTTPISVISQY